MARQRDRVEDYIAKGTAQGARPTSTAATSSSRRCSILAGMAPPPRRPRAARYDRTGGAPLAPFSIGVRLSVDKYQVPRLITAQQPAFVALDKQFDALFMLLAIVPPSRITAMAIALPTTASITAYSAAEAPLSSRRNRKIMVYT
jgi:hypothetical protein